MSMRAVSIALLSLCLSDAFAQSITLSLRGESATQTAAIDARRLDGDAPAQQRSIRIPSTEELSLGAGTWEIRVSAESLWSAPAYVRQGEAARIELWPVAELRGTSTDLQSLRVRFAALDANAPSGESVCTNDGDSWRCAMPAAGRYDLTLLARGYAPEFRWGANVNGASFDLGAIHFTKGASLTGRLAPARGVRIDVSGAEVSLFPASGGVARISEANARGLFQFRGVPPGEYAVRASKKGLTSRSEMVTIIEKTAAELTAPLLLDRPKRLDVALLPMLDPTHSPWRLSLFALDGARLTLITDAPVEADGRWSHHPLLAGDYRLEVHTNGGALWASQAVTVADEDVSLALAAVPAEITGTVKLGERPLAAKLSFGGEGGVELQADNDGVFRGFVPAPATDDPWTVLIESETPDLHRTIQVRAVDGKLSIVLPSTTLLGRVRNEDGSPEPNAILAIRAIDGMSPMNQAFAGSDGTFQLAGFTPGAYEISAEAFGRASDVMHVNVTQDVDAAELDIVLHDEVVVRGRIVTGDVPVVGAQILAFPRDANAPFLPCARSDGDGRFQFSLPPHTNVYDIFAAHPAFDVIFARVTPQHEKLLQITTQQSGGSLIVDAPAGEIVRLRHDGAELPMRWAAENTGGVAGGDVKHQHIEMKRLEAGHYSACVRDRCVAGFVPPFGTLMLDVATN
jgi:hypothetical protein